MESHASPGFCATPERIAALDRLGDEIAEVSAHLEAATAHLLDLIREFDARGGWGNVLHPLATRGVGSSSRARAFQPPAHEVSGRREDGG